MSEEILPPWFAQLFTVYGPAAVPIIGLLLVIKYLLDKDKQREIAHAEEIKAERDATRKEREGADKFQAELLTEARGNAMLAEELKRALQTLAHKTGSV